MSSQFYDITCNSIHSMGTVSVHHFYGHFHFFFCKLGYFRVSGFYFIVLSGVDTVWAWSDLQKSVHSFRISSRSDVISPDSFLMLIIICLFLWLLIRLEPFLASDVSCINSFLFLLALVLYFFFTNVFSSTYSTLSFSGWVFLMGFFVCLFSFVCLFVCLFWGGVGVFLFFCRN